MGEIWRVCERRDGHLRSGHLSSIDAVVSEDTEDYGWRGVTFARYTALRKGILLQDILAEEETKPKQTISATHCRYCKAKDHWSTQCPHKDRLGVVGDEDEPLASSHQLI